MNRLTLSWKCSPVKPPLKLTIVILPDNDTLRLGGKVLATGKRPLKLTFSFYRNLTRNSSLGKPQLKLTPWTQIMASYSLVLSSYTGNPPLKLTSLI